jgi:peptidoglycan/LPS O-acetylase OafA/YrhL
VESKQPKTKSFYRPELDVVRFFAFICVFFRHSSSLGSGHGSIYESMVYAGGFGLSLFFTLSAYLITLLLLREKSQTASVDLPAFYKRRILRIWPLYFFGLCLNLLTGLATDYHPGRGTIKAVLLALVMLGNLVHNTPDHPVTGALWSISVEEQFYVFWPATMRRLTSRQVAGAAVVILLVAQLTLLRLGLRHTEADHVWTNSFVQFECFGAGMLLAVFDHKRPVFSPILNLLLLIAAAGMCFVAVSHFAIVGPPQLVPGAADLMAGYALVAVACVLILIAFQGLKGWPKPFVYLGKISYGLYVFHGPVLILAMTYLKPHFPHGLTVICLAITTGCAALSYRYFETPFLRRKRSLELVHSRPV